MLQLLPLDDCRRLIELFLDSGYTFAALTQGRNLTERASRQYGTIKYLLEKTQEPTAFNTLARWFTIGVPVPAWAAAKGLPDWAVPLLLKSGMLRQNGDQLETTVMMSPLDTMLIASDPVLKWEESPDDLVLWPNPTTQQLFNFTIRKPVRSTLDLGCGCGVLALGAAFHSESVVATDLNPRAVEFSAFNAQLNGIVNVECLAGDCFAPVADRTFDLIFANPPFFITPSSSMMFCENTLELDLFCRKLAREAPKFLNESGYFQMICEWVEIEGQPWRERIAEWMESSGCDAWVIKQYSTVPSKYGVERGQQRPPHSEEESTRVFADWLAYVHEKKIVAVHGGLIAMRKRSGANWLRIEDEPVLIDNLIGDLILEGFETRDVLDQNSDAGLMQMSPRIAKDARLVHLLEQTDQGWTPRTLRLQLTGARPRKIDVDPGVAHFLGALNGSVRLGDVIQSMAQRTDAPIEKVARECVSVVRKLLAEGYLSI
jgi:SAM-dependent methyltransferase